MSSLQMSNLESNNGQSPDLSDPAAPYTKKEEGGKKRVSLTRNVVNNTLGRRLAGACIAILVICFIIVASLTNKSSNFYYVGGSIGAAASLYVMFGFYLKPKEFNSPLQLLFWRSFCDLGLAVRFIAAPAFNYYICGETVCELANFQPESYNRCRASSAFLEFFEIASEAWFFMIGLDLYIAINYPFFPLKSRLIYYHLAAWSFALWFALPTVFVEDFHGPWFVERSEESKSGQEVVCWITLQKPNGSKAVVNYRPFVMFYIPLIFIYISCARFLFLSYNRLKNGIPKTVLNRMRVLVLNLINISLYSLYWFLLLLIYVIATIAKSNPESSLFFFNSLLYLLAAKGFSSVLVWITALNLKFKSSNGKEDEEGEDLNTALRTEVLFSATKGIKCCTRHSQKFENQTTSERIDIRIDVNEADDAAVQNTLTAGFFIKLIFGLNTQINELNAIIQQSKAKAIESLNVETDIGAEGGEIRMTMSGVGRRGSYKKRPSKMTVDQAGNEVEAPSLDDKFEVLDSSEETGIYSIFETIKTHFLEREDKVIFSEFMPHAFRKVREAAGISDEDYIHAFSSSIKERVAEGGASGAFFFFSKGEVFIAKSCSPEECLNIQRTANAYAAYLQNNGSSYISKIYGAYRLRIYSTSLYFFVMNNIFLTDTPNSSIHEKYDIKGSWFARNAAPPAEGKMTLCTYCDKRYKYTRKRRKRHIKTPRSFTIGDGDSAMMPITAGEASNKNLFDTFSPFWQGGRNPSLSNSDTSNFSDINHDDICPVTVNGHHEPNIILKDNDLKYKFKLPEKTANDMYEQLKKDSEFLLSIGVMDYSLLVGVHNTEYDVQKIDDNDLSRNVSSDDLKLSESSPSSPPAGGGGGVATVKVGRRSSVVTSTSPQTNGIVPRPQSPSQSLPSENQEKVNNQFPSSSKSDVETRRPKSIVPDALKSNVIYCNKISGPESYCMGIIDYQQQWTIEKKIERFFKIHFRGAEPDGLSAVEPNKYRERFLAHVENILDIQSRPDPLGRLSIERSTSGNHPSIHNLSVDGTTRQSFNVETR